jgi:hypothetical protein
LTIIDYDSEGRDFRNDFGHDGKWVKIVEDADAFGLVIKRVLKARLAKGVTVVNIPAPSAP